MHASVGPRIAGGTELVVCKQHGVQRMAKYCNPAPVFNADREVISYSYSCNPTMLCAPARDRGNAPSHNLFAPAAPQVTSSSGAAAASTLSDDRLALLESSGRPTGPKPSAPGQGPTGAPNHTKRYYDLATLGAGGGRGFDARPKKVCWSCGLDTHEKPQCRNQLCKRCHGSQGAGGYGHVCCDIPPSPFVLLETLSTEELRFARCTVCHEYGHLDCRDPNAATSDQRARASANALTCCHCGECGHHGFECPHQQYPDRWVQCVQAIGRKFGYLPPERRSAAAAQSQFGMSAAPDQAPVLAPPSVQVGGLGTMPRVMLGNPAMQHAQPAYGNQSASHNAWQRPNPDSFHQTQQRQSSFQSAPPKPQPQAASGKRYRDDDDDEEVVAEFRRRNGRAALYTELSASADFRNRNARGYSAPSGNAQPQQQQGYYRDSNRESWDSQQRRGGSGNNRDGQSSSSYQQQPQRFQTDSGRQNQNWRSAPLQQNTEQYSQRSQPNRNNYAQQQQQQQQQQQRFTERRVTEYPNSQQQQQQQPQQRNVRTKGGRRVQYSSDSDGMMEF